jgi:hypothetical protein
MTHSTSKIVRIVEPKGMGQSALSKGQKTFNRLIKKIDEQRGRLAAWQAAIPRYQQTYVCEFEPLLQIFNRHQVKWVHLLDQTYTNKALTKTDRAKIADIICSVVEDLIAEGGDEELKSLYNKYSDSDFDAKKGGINDTVKYMMESMLGVDLNEDFDLNAPEKIVEEVGEKMRQKQIHQEKIQQESEARRSKRKKSAKELAKEARQQEEEQNISQSIRDVFRKLASALHPDREQDAAERSRKTALMQRVNVAYRNKDLLQLLELQLEVEQIDQTMINSISEERLKHYNKILTEQSSELQFEINDAELSFRACFNFSPFEPLTPTDALHSLEEDIRDIRYDITMLEKDLISFRNIKSLKSWLKTYRISRATAFDDMVLGMELDAILRGR